MNTDDLLARLDRARREDPERAVFGAGHRGHGYRLNAPMPPERMAEIERDLDVLLPEDYRAFLLQAADGGAGPGYGLNPFTVSNELPVPEPGEFPGVSGRPILVDPPADPEDDDAVEASISAHLDAVYRGVTVLNDEGCGMHSLLVLRGACAGQVWWYPWQDGTGIFPLRHPGTGTPMTFTDWYGLWLDSILDPGRTAIGSFAPYAPTEPWTA
ncbi:SMI1/KNR4 family protein [Cellulomonas sp. NPDC089187]|uniref:SMI1/KNR4 family protein n=1 Tax=Cellulomonas sp. NPDC089187 TaxID=3154970 RepID=UPI003421EC2B